MKKSFFVLAPTILLLSACGSGQSQQAGTIDNVPQVSSTSASPSETPDANHSRERHYSSDEVKEDTEKRIERVGKLSDDSESNQQMDDFIKITDIIEDKSPSALVLPIDKIGDEFLNKHLNSNMSGMPWATMFALGTHIDPASVVARGNGMVSANIVDKSGVVMATVTGVPLSGENLNPVEYSETDAGAQFRLDHQDISNQWTK